MNSTRHTKTVDIGDHAFTISGEREEGGLLRFTVDDLDCALPGPNDAIADHFQAAVKRRLRKIRQQRQSA
ncbi:MAG: hypothetical protein K0U74_11140 [Alphaproteobacteria bacterium]|nr:hypothetical protein [Alphaproteobacteria bacterium]